MSAEVEKQLRQRLDRAEARLREIRDLTGRRFMGSPTFRANGLAHVLLQIRNLTEKPL